MNPKVILFLLVTVVYFSSCECGCNKKQKSCEQFTAAIAYESSSNVLRVTPSSIFEVTYSWSTGANTQEIPLPAAGTYSCTVIANISDHDDCENLCSAVATYTVSGGSSSCDATVTDIDNNVYDVVKIGNQCWMKQNLKTTKYNDGAVIPTGLNNASWAGTTTGACALYNDNLANESFGRLYNWYAVETGKLCPTGWHVPSQADFVLLRNAVGGEDSAAAIKATTSWPTVDLATNSSGFTVLAFGFKLNDGTYYDNAFGIYARFWSSTIGSDSDPVSMYVADNNSNAIAIEGFPKNNGVSVRCVKN